MQKAGIFAQNLSSLQKIAVFILLFSIIAKPLYVGSVYGNYFLDVDGFIEKYCINKTKVELKCNGKCELSKQLNSSSETSSSKDKAVINVSESFVMVFFQENSFNSLDTIYTFVKNHQFTFYSSLLMTLKNHKIDHPPELY